MITIDVPLIGIPEISDEELNRRLKRIKPVVEFDGVKRYIRRCHPRNVAYTWDAKPARVADDIRPLETVTTYHTFGYHGFFKPSVAEVASQIPERLLESVVAFEIIKRPQTAEDLNLEQRALNKGFHVATTQLYARK